MDGEFPSFAPDEVALLISSVEQSLRRLRDANERAGGHDPELVEYGRRYSLVLQKLSSIAALGARG